MMEDLIERVVDALVREKSVPSSYQSKSPKTFGRTSVVESDFVFAPDFQLSNSAKLALKQYKHDAFRDMNQTLRQYQHKLEQYYEKYGMPRYYKLGYQMLSLLHDVYLGTRGQSKDRDLNVLGDPAYARDTARLSTGLAKLFKRFPWQPLETLDDWEVIDEMTGLWWVDVSNLRALANDAKDARSKFPTQTVKKITSIAKTLTSVERAIEVADGDTNHVSSFSIMQTIAQVSTKRDMVIYRAGRPEEVGLPKNIGKGHLWTSKAVMAQGQRQVGKISSRPAFLSATTDINQTDQFGGFEKVLYVITVPAGMHCLPIDLLVASDNRIEREILIGPDAKYRIDAIKRIKDDKDSPAIPENWRAWENVRVYLTLIDDGVHEL